MRGAGREKGRRGGGGNARGRGKFRWNLEEFSNMEIRSSFQISFNKWMSQLWKVHWSWIFFFSLTFFSSSVFLVLSFFLIIFSICLSVRCLAAACIVVLDWSNIFAIVAGHHQDGFKTKHRITLHNCNHVLYLWLCHGPATWGNLNLCDFTPVILSLKLWFDCFIFCVVPARQRVRFQPFL